MYKDIKKDQHWGYMHQNNKRKSYFIGNIILQPHSLTAFHSERASADFSWNSTCLPTPTPKITSCHNL